MGKGWTSYECTCGGTVHEDWDWYGNSIKCDSCDTMTKGHTHYRCECGGLICEEWDSEGKTIECDSCETPKMSKEEVALREAEKQRILKMFLKELDAAILKHGPEHVDIVQDDNDNFLGTYHSRHDSFPVTQKFALELTEEEVFKMCEKRDIGYCLN